MTGLHCENCWAEVVDTVRVKGYDVCDDCAILSDLPFWMRG